MTVLMRYLHVHGRVTARIIMRPRLLRHYHPLSTTAAPPTGATNTAAATATTTTPPPGTNPPPPAYQPGFISRHAGKLFVALVGSLVTYFYSISKSKKMGKRLREGLEERRALEPWEIDELRVANDGVLTPQRLHDLTVRAKEAFPEGKATYKDFVKFCRVYLEEQGTSLKLGHYLDRVIMYHSPQEGQLVDLVVLLMALTLTLNTTIADRVAAIHDIGAILYGKIDTQAVGEITRALTATDQIPPEAIVIQDVTQKYPIQLYKMATPLEMAESALKEARDYQAKQIKDAKDAPLPFPTLKLDPMEGLTVDDLVAILACNSVCAWGECFTKRRPKS